MNGFREFLYRRLTQLVRPALFCLLLLCTSSCAGDRCDAFVRLGLDVHVRLQSDGKPVEGARVNLADHGIPGVFSFRTRSYQACLTDSRGYCSANLKYGYSFTTYPWMTLERVKRASRPGRFRVIVQRDEQTLGETMLPDLNPEQLSGASRIHVEINIP